MDRISQIADKLHAISRPGKVRGRDLADLALLTRSGVDPAELRQAVRHIETAQGQHHVHPLDERAKNEYRLSFEETDSATDFEEAWENTQRLLAQVENKQPTTVGSREPN